MSNNLVFVMGAVLAVVVTSCGAVSLAKRSTAEEAGEGGVGGFNIPVPGRGDLSEEQTPTRSGSRNNNRGRAGRNGLSEELQMPSRSGGVQLSEEQMPGHGRRTGLSEELQMPSRGALLSEELQLPSRGALLSEELQMPQRSAARDGPGAQQDALQSPLRGVSEKIKETLGKMRFAEEGDSPVDSSYNYVLNNGQTENRSKPRQRGYSVRYNTNKRKQQNKQNRTQQNETEQDRTRRDLGTDTLDLNNRDRRRAKPRWNAKKTNRLRVASRG